MAGHSSIDFQHSTVHHHQISDRYFISSLCKDQMFFGILRQFADHHNGHAFGVVGEGQLALVVVYIAVLV